MTVTLDKSKPIHRCFGDGTPAQFYQNGRYFDAVERHIPSLDIVKPPEPPAPAAPKQEVVEDEKPPELDLVAWARGDDDSPQPPWFSVRKACFQQLGVSPQNKAEAVELILKE